MTLILIEDLHTVTLSANATYIFPVSKISPEPPLKLWLIPNNWVGVLVCLF